MVMRLPWGIDTEGKPFALPGIGGITYNIKVGDPCFGWVGDHLEPGVSSVINADKRQSPQNRAYNFLACVGNKVRVISGAAKGDKGTVLGHHGGAEHVILDFADKTLKKLTCDDKFLIKAWGQGLQLTDYPDIVCYSLSPKLLHKMNIKETEDGKLKIGVTHQIPACIMGSGIGAPSAASGDYDIQTTDKAFLKEHNLDTLRFGDIVALTDQDNVYGRSFRKGAVTIGTVIHSDCLLAGHGPGVVALMTSSQPLIETEIDPDANVAQLLSIGRFKD